MDITPVTINECIADSDIIYNRGLAIFERGGLLRIPMASPDSHLYRYDGNYGDYEIYHNSGLLQNAA